MIRSIEGGITNGDGFMWNAKGSLCGVITKTGGLTVYDVDRDFAISFEVVCSLKGVKAFYFSPLSTYLVTTERFEPKTPLAPNMSLWHVAGKARIVEGKLRKISGNAWPSMKWTSDELCCCRILAPEDSPNPSVRAPHILQVLNSKTSKTVNFDIPGISLVEISPKGTLAAIFVNTVLPDGNAFGSLVSVYDLSVDKSPLLSFTFPKPVDLCSMKWNKLCTHILVQGGTEVDETGHSYYGSSNLFLLTVSTGASKRITHDPPVHDFQWNPLDGKTFCLISGSTPFRIEFFDTEGTHVKEFVRSRKNTICWSPNGKFLALGGFGNLAGELDFYDIDSGKLFQSTKAECAVETQWAGNRVFTTASTHPRMRVDNAVLLFNYFGDRIGKLDFDELYAAKWVLRADCQADNRPASPRAFNVQQVVVEKKAAYRPPSNGVGSSGLLVRRSESPTKSIPSPPSAPPSAPPPPPPSQVITRCPLDSWFYTDPENNVHGPYTKDVMNSWNKAGYFQPNLPVRTSIGGIVLPFVSLNTLFDNTTGLFDQNMIVPKLWLSYAPKK